MKNFVIVAEATENVLSFPADITLVSETHGPNQTDPGENTIALYSFNAAPLTHGKRKQMNTSAAEIVDALRATGKTMIEIPMVWDGKNRGCHFIDPAAITYVTASAASKNDDETQPSMALLVGLKGGGYVETYAVSVEKTNELMTAAHAAIPNLRTVMPQTATSRFYRAGFTTYDPADVVRVYPNGHQVNVLYRNGYCSDFSLPDVDHNNRQLNKIYNRVARMRGDTREIRQELFEDKNLMHRIAHHSYRYNERIRQSMAYAFAAAVAADCPDLYAFKTATPFYYTSLNNVSAMYQQGNTLYVDYAASTPEGRGGMHSGGRHVSFKSEAAARAALQALRRQPS